jgi:acyl transferase domain-containing protein
MIVFFMQSGIVSVACINSPISTTITGDKEAVADLQQILENASVFNRLLKVDTAYHSHHMKIISPKYLAALGDGEKTRLPRFFTHIFTRAESSNPWSNISS